MRRFDEIYEIAAERKGGAQALEALLAEHHYPESPSSLSDDRWLSGMSKCVFQAGFNWKVVNSMWPGFEEAFYGFDVGRCSMLNDEDFDRLVSDKSIIRHGTKIRSVQQNAVFLKDIILEHGSAKSFFMTWPGENYIGLLELLKKKGSRLGGNTGQYFLRFMGVDGFILSRDVVGRLIAEGVIDKPPTSKKAMAQVQEAFNEMKEDSGQSFVTISRVLAMSL